MGHPQDNHGLMSVSIYLSIYTHIYIISKGSLISCEYNRQTTIIINHAYMCIYILLYININIYCYIIIYIKLHLIYSYIYIYIICIIYLYNTYIYYILYVILYILYFIHIYVYIWYLNPSIIAGSNPPEKINQLKQFLDFRFPIFVSTPLAPHPKFEVLGRIAGYWMLTDAYFPKKME